MKTLCDTLLFGEENMNGSENTHILQATIEYSPLISPLISTTHYDFNNK